MNIDWHFAVVSAEARQMSQSFNLSWLRNAGHVCSFGAAYTQLKYFVRFEVRLSSGRYIGASLSFTHRDTAGTMVITVANVTPLGTQGPLFKWKWPHCAAGQTPCPSSASKLSKHIPKSASWWAECFFMCFVWTGAGGHVQCMIMMMDMLLSKSAKVPKCCLKMSAACCPWVCLLCPTFSETWLQEWSKTQRLNITYSKGHKLRKREVKRQNRLKGFNS